MKSTFKILRLALPAVLLLLNFAPAAQASAQRFSVKGGIAAVEYVNAIDACRLSIVNVNAFEQISKDGPGAKSTLGSVFVEGALIDNCTGEFHEFNGESVIQPGEFTRSKVDKATLKKSVTVCTTDDCMPADVDLEWDGLGSTFSVRYVSHSDAVGMRLLIKGSQETHENTDVHGSVKVNGIERAQGEMTPYFTVTSQSQVTIEKQPASFARLLATYALSSPTLPTSSSAKYTAKGGVVTAVWFDQLDDCKVQLSIVQAYEEADKQGTGPAQQNGHAFFQGFLADQCTGEFHQYGGDADTLPGEYAQKRLDTATLKKTMDVCGDEGCVPAAIDLTWTGSGETLSALTSSQATIGGTRILQHLKGSTREFTDVRGTIGLLGRNWATGGLQASINQSTTAYMTIER